MSPGLGGEISKLSVEDWHYWATEGDGKVREWAELPYVPSRKAESKGAGVGVSVRGGAGASCPGGAEG